LPCATRRPEFALTLRRRGVLAVAAFVIASLSVCSRAMADEAKDVAKIVQRGIDFRKAGRDAEALAEFQRAAKIEESPRITAQIALAEQALGLWLNAHRDLLAALEHSDDSWIRKNRLTLDKSREAIESNLGRVEVWGAPSGAAVTLDDKSIGKLPSASTWLAPTEATLRVSAAGYEDFVRLLNVNADSRIREHVDLRHLLPHVAAAAPAEAAPAGTSLTSHSEMPVSVQPAHVSFYERWWFWTAIGAGVIAAGTGTWLLTHRGSSGVGCSTSPCSVW
jgi:PEGA domain